MKIRVFFAIIFLLFTAQVLSAQQQDKIARVEIVGNERIDKGFIVNAIRTKENEIFDSEKIREDIKNVYKTGFFSDVQVDSKESPEGRIITFVVVERPPINSIYVSGNKNVKTSDIRDKLKVKTNSVLNTEKLRESVEEIRKLYSEKGYYATKVSYTVDYPEGYRADVRFSIEESEKAVIRAITFKGNKQFSASKLKDVMRTKEKGFFSWITNSGVLEEETLSDDKRMLEAFYYDNGYVRAKISAPEVTFSTDGRTITIAFSIDEGSVYKIGDVFFKGDLLFPNHQILPKLKSKKGETFRASLFQTDMLTLIDLYQDEGYAFVDVDPLTEVHDESKTMHITFNITKGPEVFFNRINVIGNIKTRDKVVRRELRFAEGERYSASKLKESKRRLRNTTYFKELDLKTVKTDEPDKVNLDVVVEEKPTGSLSFGVGYSSYEKVMVTGSISQANLFGTGRRISLEAALGSVTQDFNLSYIEPYLFDKDLSAGINAFNMTRSFDTYDYDSTGGSVFLSRPLTDFTRVGAKYKFESVDVTNIADDASSYIKEQAGSATTSSVTLSISRNTIDDVLNPSKGDIAEASFEFAGGPFLGDNDFYKAIASYGRYIPYKFGSAFFIRATAGTIRSYAGDEVPVYERFFVGGINTVRGFKYGEAGPLDETGEVIGAKNELIFNTEWIFPIYVPAGLKGVVFFDAGHGFNDEKGFLLDGIRTGAGFGVRWFSPLGPIRLELGFNLSPKKGERGNVFDFMIGRSF
ncbi:MAG TPA: outer membrane protein assembly factor BamA [Deltaproteobacteria bacterium]|nr:outer membrane protein assembly factor BamA [Deltaproteobacteria bacterium]